jgi:hypothetical protein
MVRTLAVVVLLLSPSPLVCLFATEVVLEHATVTFLEHRLRRGELTVSAAAGTLAATPAETAQALWRDSQDVNFAVGLVFLLACASSGALAVAGVGILLKSRRGAGPPHAVNQ